MAVGQIANVVVCATSDIGSANGQVFGPVSASVCPPGQNAYVVQSYVPFASAQGFFDGLSAPFDSAVAASIFGFGFGLVVVFFLLGLKGSVILRPFWGGRY